MSIYELKKDINLVFLEGEEAFNQLDNSEKLYAYYMSKAAWVGSLITSKQVSPESHDLIKFCVSIFHENDKLDNMVSMGLKHGFSEEESNDFLNYFAIICANMGNYRSFGDSKIIPHIEKRRMIELVSALFKDYLIVFMKLVDKIYSLESKERLLGFPPTGTTSYFSSNVTKDEVSKVDRYLVSKGIEGWNTQLTKVDTESGPIYFINIASAQIPPEKHVISIEEFEGSDMSVVYGNYSEELGFVNNYLQSARDNVDNSKYPDRNKMILAYIDHFRYGDIADHKLDAMQELAKCNSAVGPTSAIVLDLVCGEGYSISDLNRTMKWSKYYGGHRLREALGEAAFHFGLQNKGNTIRG